MDYNSHVAKRKGHLAHNNCGRNRVVCQVCQVILKKQLSTEKSFTILDYSTNNAKMDTYRPMDADSILVNTPIIIK